ncbi:MAG: hypothetical protein M3Y59_03455 [Myxococcota bacterium]|nr:hypothetical protein [Myxococcota bacterium]
MIFVRTFLPFAVILAVACAPPNPEGFEFIEASGPGTGLPHLTTSADGQVWMLHTLTASHPRDWEVQLSRLGADGWEAAGAPLTGLRLARFASGAAAEPRLRWIAPYEPGRQEHSEVWGWSGSGYVRETSFLPPAASQWFPPTIHGSGVDPAGRHLVGFGETPQELRVFAQDATGAYVSLGDRVVTEEEAGKNNAMGHVEFVFLPNGEPVAVYLQGSSSGTTFGFKRFNGSEWEAHAPQLVPVDLVDVTGWDVQLDATGRLLFVYSTNQAGQGENAVHVHRLSAEGDWENLGRLTGEGPSSGEFPHIRHDASGRVFVSFVMGEWAEARIHLFRLTGAEWTQLGATVNAGGSVWHAGLTLTADGTPILAWSESQPSALGFGSSSSVYSARYVGP